MTSTKNKRALERYQAIRRVTFIGALVDLALGVLKMSIGSISNSHALFADGVHSLSDLSTDLLVVFVAKHSHDQADEEHPYGHARFETMATVALGLALIAVGIGVAVDATFRLLRFEVLLVPGHWALFAALLSVGAKELIYHYTMRYARRFKSKLLKANAWHSRSDALSSIVVIVGVLAAMAGLPIVDVVAALVVAVMIAHIGWSLGWSSIKELVDTGLSEQEVEEIRQVILSVDGIDELHMLRTRQMGGQALVDVHLILVDPKISVSEGHQLSETVRSKLINAVDDVVDVTVHIDPEDDEHYAASAHLPLRGEVLEVVKPRLAPLDGFQQTSRIDLHYLDAKIDIVLQLPLRMADTQERMAERQRLFEGALSDLPWIANVVLTYAPEQQIAPN